ncbi:hypothetical protein BC6307_18095 [Sutcliffiella cohnii]|uniref:Uncharacterized protein n=1 Tax=Sutcliffiella cohnii TaxID=33932 RepID=A0A223KU64_9BACI|nr:hypothetical protein [Sutcliffiella cohnii]AST93032.1 hypothetical protein BC6307_18095 [Sutcliffiella cohnii]
MQGYIKDFRKELESSVWMMPPLYHRTWQYLKYKVNHQDNRIPMRDGTFLTIKAGQHLTSVRDIAKNIGWYEGVKWQEPNPKTVSTILSWLEKQSMISIDRGKGNRQYTLITLINWESYQSNNVEGNSEVTDREHLVDINKNDKECIKNDKDIAAATNAHATEDSDGVPTTDPLRGDPVPSGEISHTSEQAIKVLLDRFIQLRAYGFDFSPADERAAYEILNANVPIEDALIYLKERFDNYKPKHSRDRINSLSYCVGYILDKHQQKLDSKKLAKRRIQEHGNPKHGGNLKEAAVENESITGGRVGWIRKSKV